MPGQVGAGTGAQEVQHLADWLDRTGVSTSYVEVLEQLVDAVETLALALFQFVHRLPGGWIGRAFFQGGVRDLLSHGASRRWA